LKEEEDDFEMNAFKTVGEKATRNPNQKQGQNTHYNKRE